MRRAVMAGLGPALLLLLLAAPERTRAQSEWGLHKSADGLHPSPQEQEMLWLMNRARSDPSAEGEWLASSTEPAVAAARDGANPNAIRQAFDALLPAPPAAFDRRLWAASVAHNQSMIDRNCAFDHDGQLGLIDAAGFVTGNPPQGFSARVSIAFGGSPTNRHAALNIDTGFDPPGHRHAIMSTDGDYTNVGIALRSNLGNCFSPLLFSAAYAYADETMANHHNRFVVGTIWRDLDQNGRFDAGEGVEGVTVATTPGNLFAVSAAGGGYALPITAPGSLTVHFDGGGVPPGDRGVVMGAESQLVDYQIVPEPGGVLAFLGAVSALWLCARRRERAL